MTPRTLRNHLPHHGLPVPDLELALHGEGEHAKQGNCWSALEELQEHVLSSLSM